MRAQSSIARFLVFVFEKLNFFHLFSSANFLRQTVLQALMAIELAAGAASELEVLLGAGGLKNPSPTSMIAKLKPRNRSNVKASVNIPIKSYSALPATYIHDKTIQFREFSY